MAGLQAPMHYPSSHQRSSSFGRWMNDYETRNEMYVPFAQLQEEDEYESEKKNMVPEMKTTAYYSKPNTTGAAPAAGSLPRRHSEAAKRAQELSECKGSEGSSFRLPKKGVPFIVKYVGRDQVIIEGEHYDNSQQAVAMIQSTTPEEMYKRVSLRISSSKITVTEEIANVQITEIPIHRICQCRWNPYDPCTFSFVAFEKSMKQYFCYVFHSQTESAGEINKAFGQAFRDAYEDALAGGYASQQKDNSASKGKGKEPATAKLSPPSSAPNSRRSSSNPFDNFVAKVEPRKEFQTDSGEFVSSSQLDAFSQFAKGRSRSSQSSAALSSSQLEAFNNLSVSNSHSAAGSKRSSYSSVQNNGREIPTTDDLISF
eukprot:Nk52_evm43s223 gene=Nk52_evmTU43s223